MKTQTSLNTVKTDILAWLDSTKWRFSTVYAIDLKDSLEVQWVFAPIGRTEELQVFYATANYTDTIPSINDIAANAWIAEWELFEMMGVGVENANKGLLLEPDAPVNPLRKDAK